MALRDFYTNNCDLITDAIEHTRAQYHAAVAGYHSELDTVLAQLAAKEAIVDRYLTDYEDGKINRDVVARRVEKVSTEIDQLRRNRDTLRLRIDTEPAQPTPAQLAALSGNVLTIINEGTTVDRKNLCEATLVEVRLNPDDTATPIFRIPDLDADAEHRLTRTKIQRPRSEGVREHPPTVEPRGLEPLTPTLPVWCATSCATAPCAPPVRRHSRNITHRPAQGHTGSAAQLRVGSAGYWATAAIRPPCRRSTIGHRSSGRGANASLGSASNTSHEPTRDLALELPRRPARVAGEHPYLDHAVHELLRVAGQVDRADGPRHPVEADHLLDPAADTRQADRRLRLHGTALEHHGRVAGQRAPVAEHVGDLHLGGAVEDDARARRLPRARRSEPRCVRSWDRAAPGSPPAAGRSATPWRAPRYLWPLRQPGPDEHSPVHPQSRRHQDDLRRSIVMTRTIA